MLLNENYVEDDDNMFRFDYSPEFLRWALQPPGSLREWHVGVRSGGSFIFADKIKINLGSFPTLGDVLHFVMHD